MDNTITLTEDRDIVYSSFQLHKNGITPIGTPTFEQWQEVGKFIQKAGGAVHFWLGDWLNYGEQKWGEMYTQAIEDTGYDYGTLVHDKSVAGRIELGRRRPNLSFSHHAEVAKFEPKIQDKLLEQADKEQMPTKEFRELVKKTPHVSFNSGENEWYTPSEYIEAARQTMGSIDIDPASSDKANEIVKAGKYFTKETNGLAQAWEGNVWMNPPYEQGLVDSFSESVTAKFKNGEIQQACVLVNNATETGWFQRMASECAIMCLIKGRIKFLDKTGTPANTPLQGQIILYFGKNGKKFADVFQNFGLILWTETLSETESTLPE